MTSSINLLGALGRSPEKDFVIRSVGAYYLFIMILCKKIFFCFCFFSVAEHRKLFNFDEQYFK